MHFADENGVTDLTITAVDDVPMEQILATIDSLFPAENEMAVAKNYNYYFTSENLLKTAGVNVAKAAFTVTLSDGSTRECRWFEPVETADSSSEPWGNKARWDGDVFVVEFVECVDDDNLKAIARELKQAVANGCTKVIIDARGNGGGSSRACERLLNAMGMKAPSYGMLVRYSQEAKEQVGYLRSSGTCRMEPNPAARRNEQVNLVVLCDRFTYSSATMLCVYVRDGQLGTLIGEASANMPNPMAISRPSRWRTPICMRPFPTSAFCAPPAKRKAAWWCQTSKRPPRKLIRRRWIISRKNKKAGGAILPLFFLTGKQGCATLILSLYIRGVLHGAEGSPWPWQADEGRGIDG